MSDADADADTDTDADADADDFGCVAKSNNFNWTDLWFVEMQNNCDVRLFLLEWKFVCRGAISLMLELKGSGSKVQAQSRGLKASGSNKASGLKAQAQSLGL